MILAKELSSSKLKSAPMFLGGMGRWPRALKIPDGDLSSVYLLHVIRVAGKQANLLHLSALPPWLMWGSGATAPTLPEYPTCERFEVSTRNSCRFMGAMSRQALWVVFASLGERVLFCFSISEIL